MKEAKSKRVKQAMDIPKNIDVETAIKIYNQGWGHSLASTIHWFQKHAHINFNKDLLVEYMNNRREGKRFHKIRSSVTTTKPLNERRV